MRFFTVASAVIGLAQAAPYESPRLEKRIPAGPEYNNIELFTEYAAAAYKAANFQPRAQGSSAPLLCNAESCPVLTASTNKPMIVFSGNMPDMPLSLTVLLNPFIARTGFYVARDTNHSSIIVAFQGTDPSQGILNAISSISQINTDLFSGFVAERFTGPNCPTCAARCVNCQVAAPFQDTYNAVSTGIITAVKSELAKPGQANYTVVFTGHSLGAALAGIAAAQARTQNIFAGSKVDLYSYASPRIGNNEFAISVTNQNSFNSSTFRVTHNGDFVPRSPLLFTTSLVLFSLGATADHFGPEYYISKPFNQPVTPADVIKIPAVISGGKVQESQAGVLGSPLTLSGTGHNFYINPINCPNC